MEAKAGTDDRFYTPRSSARRGYSSTGSEDERFVSPRGSARSVSSGESEYVTPREIAPVIPRRLVHQVGNTSELRDAAPPADDYDLFSAARHNHYDSVIYMLDQGVPVNSRDAFGNTLLTIACQNGLKRITKLALRRGANINSQNNRGNTALHFCFAYGYGDSLGAYLISKGADTTIENDDGMVCYYGITQTSPASKKIL
ncbi:Histone-lysine N-methyltransferase [Phytophthora nicotianae]|uniref:Histone-lysine N-methyltransferase n=1 Tax=Phytophthora nicotianae TaxID=4792 RepID=A0A0W8D3U4_PHYNI|nr:Histone-lysine N-methyltransferase [Phytophthora nicotianae]